MVLSFRTAKVNNQLQFSACPLGYAFLMLRERNKRSIWKGKQLWKIKC